MAALILHALLTVFLVACGRGGGGVSNDTTTPAFTLNLIKTVDITTDADGGSARPEIIAASADRVFVVYLGNIRSNRTFDVKIYNSNLDTVIASKTLVSTSSDYGSPTDIRVASDGQYLYAFYETNKTTSPTTAITYLWGAKYTLDDNFNRVAYTAAPITNSKPMSELQDGGELVDDPAPLVRPNTVFVITRLKYSLSTTGNTIYRVREFSKDNLATLSEFDLDLSNVADGRGRVTSFLYWNNSIFMALATTVSDQGVNEGNDDSAKSDIVLVKMTQNWTFNPQNDVQIISAEPDDRENYAAGFKTDGNYFYITYKQAVGSPPTGEQRALIKIFDNNFNQILREQVKSAVWGTGGGEIRPSLEVMGNRIFSGQSSGQGIGSGNAEIYVYEK
ncbi:MAG: hypothetical protein FJ241_09740 [Nitrospira sp.]|nr:hypothetical protein [Nitrospira sp.]